MINYLPSSGAMVRLLLLGAALGALLAVLTACAYKSTIYLDEPQEGEAPKQCTACSEYPAVDK